MNYRKPYQLSLERPAGRYTDKEWDKELAVREARNANLRLTNYNFTRKRPVKRYVKWLKSVEAK